MFTMANEKFSEWLQLEINKRSWSQAELSRRSRLSKSQISLVLSNQRDPGKDFLVQVASALSISPDTVFSIAGIFPTEPESDQQTREAEWLLKNLPPDLREEAINYIHYLASKKKGIDEISTNRSMENP